MSPGDWSSDVCSSDLETMVPLAKDLEALDVYFQLVRLRDRKSVV